MLAALWALSLQILLCLAQQRQSYDYIICGGGTTGLALANELTADPNIHVLVIEAGPNGGTFNRATMTWPYSTVAQVAADNRSLQLQAGRLVGGSSQING